MKPRRLVALAVSVVALAIGTFPAGAQLKAAGDQSGPLDLVKASVSRVLAIVQAPHVPRDGGATASRNSSGRPGLFDFDEMARLTLARHWKDRSVQEREEFVRLFTDLLERSYLTTIENYAGEKITLLGESISGPYAQVRSRITTDRRIEISIEYRLLESGRGGRCTTWCWTA